MIKNRYDNKKNWFRDYGKPINDINKLITESDIFIIFDILGGVSAVENQQDSGQIVILSPGQQKRSCLKRRWLSSKWLHAKTYILMYVSCIRKHSVVDLVRNE